MCESIAKRRGRWQDVSMPRRTNQIMKAHGILIYRHFGSLNRGNEAIVRGTSSLLKEICGPELRIRVASRAPREDQRVFLPAVDAMMGIGNPWSGHPLLWRLHAAVEWRLRKPEHRVVWDSLQTLRWARRSDVCLSVGGDRHGSPSTDPARVSRKCAAVCWAFSRRVLPVVKLVLDIQRSSVSEWPRSSTQMHSQP